MSIIQFDCGLMPNIVSDLGVFPNYDRSGVAPAASAIISVKAIGRETN